MVCQGLTGIEFFAIICYSGKRCPRRVTETDFPLLVAISPVLPNAIVYLSGVRWFSFDFKYIIPKNSVNVNCFDK
jgi:hypothetical protein